MPLSHIWGGLGERFREVAGGGAGAHADAAPPVCMWHGLHGWVRAVGSAGLWDEPLVSVGSHGDVGGMWRSGCVD